MILSRLRNADLKYEDLAYKPFRKKSEQNHPFQTFRRQEATVRKLPGMSALK